MAVGQNRRVVVTGMGAVCPLGKNVRSIWEGVVNGRLGIGNISLFDATHWPVQIAGEVPDFNFSDYEDPRQASLTPIFPG
ncbi:MAG: beta-ketoacyl synthase N-terminal-like domain-containing protein [Planctomycetaceae bacterium]